MTIKSTILFTCWFFISTYCNYSTSMVRKRKKNCKLNLQLKRLIHFLFNVADLGNLLVQDRTFYAQVVHFIQSLAFDRIQRKYFTLQHVESKPRTCVLQTPNQLRIVLRLKNCHCLTFVNKSIFYFLLFSWTCHFLTNSNAELWKRAPSPMSSGWKDLSLWKELSVVYTHQISKCE